MTAKRISALFFIVCLVAGLSSCGRTGKLYLAEDKASETPAQSNAPAGANDSKSKTNE